MGSATTQALAATTSALPSARISLADASDG